MALYRMQGPGEAMDWTVDYTADLGSTSPPDEIQTSDWRVEGHLGGSPEPVISNPSIAEDKMSASCKLEGLVHGTVYLLTNTVLTSMNLTFERTLTIRCHRNR